jgi:hypothetical protein
VPLVRETGVPWPMSLAALIPKLRERVDSDSKMPPNARQDSKIANHFRLALQYVCPS